MAATGTGGLLLALLLAFHTLAIRDEQLGRDDSADALAAGEAAATGADAAVAASALGRLGHRAGDVVFGKFRLVEYRGFAPIGEGVPALYPGHWRPRARPLPEGERAQEAGAWAGALLEGGQGGNLSHNPFPVKIKDYKPNEDVGKKGYLGYYAFGEVWEVKAIRAVDEGGANQTYVLKLFYDGEDELVTDEQLKGDKKGLLGYVDLLSKECQSAKDIQEAAANITEDTQVRGYADKFMKCYKYSGPGMEAYSKHKKVKYRDSSQEDTYIYLLLEACGSESIENKVFPEVGGRTDWLTATKAAWVTRELGKGLRYLEEVGYLHRDLKPANLIVGGSGDSGELLKIIDFGMVVKKDTPAFIGGGTHDYIPNEHYDNDGRLKYVHEGLPFTAFDMFSTHVIILEMLTWRTWFDCTRYKVVNQSKVEVSPADAHKRWTRNFMVGWIQSLSNPQHLLLSKLVVNPLFVNPTFPLPERNIKKANDFLELWLRMGDLDPKARPTPSELLSNAWVKGER